MRAKINLLDGERETLYDVYSQQVGETRAEFASRVEQVVDYVIGFEIEHDDVGVAYQLMWDDGTPLTQSQYETLER